MLLEGLVQKGDPQTLGHAFWKSSKSAREVFWGAEGASEILENSSF